MLKVLRGENSPPRSVLKPSPYLLLLGVRISVLAMNAVVLSSSCLQPWSLVCSGVGDVATHLVPPHVEGGISAGCV